MRPIGTTSHKASLTNIPAATNDVPVTGSKEYVRKISKSPKA
jgi:hypothetical protein